MSFWPNTDTFQQPQLPMPTKQKQSKHKQTNKMNIMLIIMITKHNQIHRRFTIKDKLMTWTEALIHLTHQFRPIIFFFKPISIYVIYTLFLFIILLLLLSTNKVLLVSCKNNSDSNQINYQQRFIQKDILQPEVISKI